MDSLLVQPDNQEQMKAIKAFLKVIKVNFTEQKKKPYRADWEAKMKRSEEDYKAGRTEEIKTEDLWK